LNTALKLAKSVADKVAIQKAIDRIE